MGLNRIALRLAVVEALAPTDATVFPTLAGDRVYDTATPIFDVTTLGDSTFGYVQVTTEDSSTKPAGTARDHTGGVEARCRLALEMTYARSRRGEDGGLSFEANAASIAMLDCFEFQVLTALERARRSGGPLARAVIHFDDMESEQAMDADLAVPLAIRRLVIECRVPRVGVPAAAEAGLARLPSPLREVALALPESSYGAGICTRIAGLITGEEPMALIEAMSITATLTGQNAEDVPAASGTLTMGG